VRAQHGSLRALQCRPLHRGFKCNNNGNFHYCSRSNHHNDDLVDTPGIGTYRDLAAFGLMERDIPVWCTVACQAWKDSERRIWEALPPRSWRHAVLAVTNADLIVEHGALDGLITRLRSQTAGLFTDVLPAGKPMEDGPSFHDRCIGIEQIERRLREIASAKAVKKARVGQRLAARVLTGAQRLKEMPATGAACPPV